MQTSSQLWRKPIVAGCALLLLCGGPMVRAQNAGSAQCTSAAPDNSAMNKAHRKTADQQKDNASDRTITQNIRKSVMADKSLSTYAHNCKIITMHGAVTLKGPVHSEEEKQSVGAKAAAVVGQGKVTNQLTVK